MDPWLKLLVCLQFLGIVCCHQTRGSIICYLRLSSNLDESVRSHLRKCSHIVICNDVCDRSKALLPYPADKVSLLKSMVPLAKIMLSVPLSVNPFELRVDENSEQFCQEVEVCLADGAIDGIDLDFNAFSLEFADQILFGQFLTRLRQRLRSKIIISLSLDVQRYAPGPLGDSVRKNVDFIVTSRDELLIDGEGEFLTRKYSDDAIDCLLDAGFPPNKIVLGMQTAGIAMDPSKKPEIYYKRCAIVGLIPYGQVCELRDQSSRFCSWRSDHRCLLFEGRSKLIYDSPETAKERALQSSNRRLKGVSILLNYDDGNGICGSVKYPLLNSVYDVLLAHNTTLTDPVKNSEKDQNLLDQEGLADKMDRLEMAIEDLHKSSNLLQKIATLLLRALYKIVEVVVAFVSRKDIDETRKTEEVPSLGIEEEENLETFEHAADDDLDKIGKEISELAEEQEMLDTINSEIDDHKPAIDVPQPELAHDNPILQSVGIGGI